jgi:hypothetical protein
VVGSTLGNVVEAGAMVSLYVLFPAVFASFLPPTPWLASWSAAR